MQHSLWWNRPRRYVVLTPSPYRRAAWFPANQEKQIGKRTFYQPSQTHPHLFLFHSDMTNSNPCWKKWGGAWWCWTSHATEGMHQWTSPVECSVCHLLTGKTVLTSGLSSPWRLSNRYPLNISFAKSTAPLNVQVRSGVNGEPLNVIGMRKLIAIMTRIFNALAPCNATSITSERTTLRGIRWSRCFMALSEPMRRAINLIIR